MYIAIVGSRSFSDYELFTEKMIELLVVNTIMPTKIISGGAKGVDTLAEQFAEQFNIPTEIIKPDWTLGRGAGMIRNSEIIKNANVVVAFWDGKSKGTADSINKAKRGNKILYIIYV